MIQTKKQKTRMLVEGAIMIALATILSFIQIVKFPWGGSITILSMLPIVLFSLRYGVKYGLGVAFVYSLIQFIQGMADGIFGWGLTPVALIACIFIDYIFAFTVLGIAGAFGNKKMFSIIGGVVVALFGRFVCHFISGVLIFNSFGELWSGFSTDNSWLYSLLYNGAYMLPEIIFTTAGAIILLKTPAIRRLLFKNEENKS